MMVALFPNPTAKKAVVRWPENEHYADLRLLSVDGQVLEHWPVDDQHEQDVDLSQLCDGVYWLHLHSAPLDRVVRLVVNH